MLDIYNNKTAFLNLKPKSILLGNILLVIILFLICLFINFKPYAHYLSKGYVTCSDTCYVVSFIPSDIDVLKITINNEEISYTIHDKILQIDDDKRTAYYKIKFTCDKNLRNNDIVKLNFFYKK